jgi:hypothetical protein
LVYLLLPHGKCFYLDLGLANVVKIGITVVEWVGLTVAFWRMTGAVYRVEHANNSEGTGAGTREALKSKVTWLCALFFFAYMGVEGE